MQADLKSLRGEFVNYCARMLPNITRYQSQQYRLGDRLPPPGLIGYQPRWEPLGVTLGARQTQQFRLDLMTGFHALAYLASSSLNTVGGFRVQVRDQRAKQRLVDRPMEFPCIGGGAASPYFLREPYLFVGPRPQALVILQNMEPNQNTVQFVIYGVAEPFFDGGRDGR